MKDSFKSEIIFVKNETDFRIQCEQLLKKEEFKELKNIVYYYISKNPIPRVIGENEIFYIGKTKNSFIARYGAKFKSEIDIYYERFKAISDKYGGIQIKIKVVQGDSKIVEAEELRKYCEKHKEYPPFNRNSSG